MPATQVLRSVKAIGRGDGECGARHTQQREAEEPHRHAITRQPRTGCGARCALPGRYLPFFAGMAARACD